MEINSSAPENIVVFSNNSLLNIQKKTNINGKNIYQVDLGRCLRYISTEDNIVYIGIIYNNALNVFNLIEDGVFTDDFKSEFEMINENRVLYILTNRITNSNDRTFYNSIIKFFESIPNFSYIGKDELFCKDLINLDEAKEIINDLNIELNKTCPNFKINVDYVFNFKDPSIVALFDPDDEYYRDHLLLCLFNGNNCVSSLTIHLNKNLDEDNSSEISFDSKTDEHYEGRKFNKLLRAVIIIIAKALDENARFILSGAINPISALLMLKNFNAISDVRKINKDSTFNDIKKVIDSSKYESVNTRVDLIDENVENARNVFNRTLNEINCSTNVVAGGKCNKNYSKRKTRRRKTNKKKKNSKRRKTRRRK
jgi:hypothetical protein